MWCCLQLLEWTISHGLDHLIYGLELGNEQNTQYTGDEMAQNTAVLHNLTIELWPNAARRPTLFGPDPHSLHDRTGAASRKELAWIAAWLEGCARRGVPVHGVTHHEYVEVSPTPTGFTSPSRLDLNREIGDAVHGTVRAVDAHVGIWGGEIGPHNGGSPPCDHTSMRWAVFGDSLWYADALAAKAAAGYEGFCRQDLIGADYGLLDCSTGAPLPDFYVALAFSQLMGRGVLHTSVLVNGTSALPRSHTNGGVVRAYTHCSHSADGGVTVLVINLANTSTMVHLESTIEHAYVLTADTASASLTGEGGLLGTSLRLNGVRLVPQPDGTVPPLTPRLVHNSRSSRVPAQSLSFLVLPNAKHSECLTGGDTRSARSSPPPRATASAAVTADASHHARGSASAATAGVTAASVTATEDDKSARSTFQRTGASKSVATIVASPLTLQLDARTGEYNVSVAGAHWWSSAGAGAAVNLNGTWHTSGVVGSASRLRLLNVTRSTGSDRLGAFERVALDYLLDSAVAAGARRAASLRLRMAFSAYSRLDSAGFFVVSQAFPDGLPTNAATAGGALDELATSAFTVRQSAVDLTLMAFMGQQLQDTSLVAWPAGDDALHVPSPGKQSVAPFAGAPFAAFDRSGASAVVGPLANFFTTSCRPSASLGASIACGATSAVEAVPAGWSHEVVLLGRVAGVVAAVRAYGDLLLLHGGKKDRRSAAAAQARDVPISTLGYYSDNGAYYYYTTEAKATQEVKPAPAPLDAKPAPAALNAHAAPLGGPCSVGKHDEHTPNTGCESYELSLQLALDEMRNVQVS